jgi:2-keto-4-pentenoate hydratase/2-oxohepta-3-ene-1,7-dioic acid hydratase in catechol pathway
MPVFVRYACDGGDRYGEVQGESVLPLDGEIGGLRPSREPPRPLAGLQLLAPARASKIVCAGGNFRIFYGDGPRPDRPMFWIRPQTTFVDPDGVIERPQGFVELNHESELGIVIRRRAHRVPEAEALDYVWGYTCVNDATLGDFTDFAVYRASPYFVIGKNFDSTAAFGPVVVTGIDPHDLRIQCRVNGETRQDHTTSDLLFGPAQLIALISEATTLLPGDVIATGSPPGQQPLRDGDAVEVELEKIGVLRNRVRNGPAPAHG